MGKVSRILFLEGGACPRRKKRHRKKTLAFNAVESTIDFQSEVGKVFGEIGGELLAKFGRSFASFFCWGKSSEKIPPKLHRKLHHQTSLRGSGLWRALLLLCYHFQWEKMMSPLRGKQKACISDESWTCSARSSHGTPAQSSAQRTLILRRWVTM